MVSQYPMKQVGNALKELNCRELANAVFMLACATFVLCTTAAAVLAAPTFATLYSFDQANGANPAGGLVQAINGNLYGTTLTGGSGCNVQGEDGCGTVFEITPSGTLTTLLSFDGTNGANPYATLVQTPNGNFYGTTAAGGSYGIDDYYGTVFKITPNGTLTTLYSFCDSPRQCPNATVPIGGLVHDTNGNFYGTTSQGILEDGGDGAVFKITSSGTLKVLHIFDNLDFQNGETPTAALVQSTNGNFLYGTTFNGGAYSRGTVFKITPSGTLTTLYSFCSQSGCMDGEEPMAGLVQATDGNFYGTTSNGGANGGGTVFEITPSGTLTTLHSFDGTDGSEPIAGLMQATDGNFYGTTRCGGNGSTVNNCDTGAGTVFEITPSGTLTTLYSFCSQSDCMDGFHPYAPALVQDTNGTFYGTTTDGGANGYGTVFSLSLGLGPFVETLPTSGKVRTPVKILGTNLTGVTSVTFNRSTASFKVVSSSEITTHVPTGATTGTVQVVTPTGTLSSNVDFRVSYRRW